MHIKGFKHTGRGPTYGAHKAPTGKAVGKPMCFAEGGMVPRMKTMTDEAMMQTNATEQRDKPLTDLDRVSGGKSPLRPGFKKGGPIKGKMPTRLMKAEGGKVGNVSAAMKAVQALVNRGIPAEKAAAVAAAQHGVDRGAISAEMAKKGLTPNPQMLARGGAPRRGYGSFNRTPRVQS